MKSKTVFPVLIKTTCEFRVWAPKVRVVHLELKEPYRLIEMQQQELGYWFANVENVAQGTRYRYNLGNGQSYPDPASLSQPDGVHEDSEVIDLEGFGWSDNNWENIPLNTMIQYELHTGTFSPEGTFNGIIKRLDYFKQLGINAIELLPVAQFSGTRNWGYDGVYPFAVQNSYGGAYGLMNLVNECHKKGIAIILDVVYNHFGPEGNYAGNFGYYFSGKYSTPWGNSINFDDAYSDEVRNYVIQNALMWCRYFHIDGLRLDAVHSIFDFSAKHIMQELVENLNLLSQETGRKHYLIAESHLNDVRYINPVAKGGYGIDAQWSDDFHHAVHTLVTREKQGYYFDFGNPQQLSKSIKKTFVFDGNYSGFRKKSYGNSAKNNPGEQFVIFNQNHDQIGNRLRGDRLISLTDFEIAKTIAGAMFVTPNIPMLFMGEEYGERNPFYYFVNHINPELNRLVREGRKNEFKDFYTYTDTPLNPDDLKAFEDSKLGWNIENDPEKKAMFNFYRELIQLRKNHPILQNPDKDNIEISEDGRIFILKRWKNNSRLLAVLNFEEKPGSAKVNLGPGEKMDKILDSADTKWNGPGEIAQAGISVNVAISVKEKSIVIYSN